MLIVLYILIASALLVPLVQLSTPYGRLLAPLGILAALAVHLYYEGLDSGGTAGSAIDWPAYLSWLGSPDYRTDTLAASLGAWCLLLGLLLVLALAAQRHAAGQRQEGTLISPVDSDGAWQVALCTLLVAVLYSLLHTFNLLAFAMQLLLVAALVWALASMLPSGEVRSGHSTLGLGLGAIFVTGAALVIGRTTGGQYSLTGLSLSALTNWTLILVLLGAALWMGLVPFTAWSARAQGGHTALVQSLATLIPAAALILRLEALLTAQGLAGSVPGGWGAFTSLLAWGGAITAIAAGAGGIVFAGTPRWSALLTAHAAGLVAWGLGLDNPASRYAAIAVLLAYGAARVTLELGSTNAARRAISWGTSPQAGFAAIARGVAVFTAAGVPLTAGFVGVWLLGAALLRTRHPSLVILLAGATILAIYGAALHLAGALQPRSEEPVEDRGAGLAGFVSWLGLLGGLLLLLAGVAPGLWLPAVAAVASTAGGRISAGAPWPGLQADNGLIAPLLLLGLMALSLSAIGWLLGNWSRGTAGDAGFLLPTALGRLQDRGRESNGAFLPVPPQQAPAPAWWLSLQWIEEGIWGFGTVLVRLGTRAGLGLGRLEGRYYLPLALILALIAVLAITR